MSNKEPKSLDVLGIKPIGDAIKIATENTFKAAGQFLGRICLPAAEEFGLLIKDRVSHWRATQAAKIAQKAEAKLPKNEGGSLQAHPRLVFQVIETGSWSDDDVIQEAWAGILASSCTEEGRDDSNIVFASLLSQLTGVQLRILNYAVEQSAKYIFKTGLPGADSVAVSLEKLVDVCGCADTHRLDRELDHLRSLALIGGPVFGEGGGFSPDSETLEAGIGPTALALHLYVRGHGFVGSPVEFFSLKPKPEKESKVATVPTPESIPENGPQ